jgi:hypothetical protein
MVLWEADRVSLWPVYDERDPVRLEEDGRNVTREGQ